MHRLRLVFGIFTVCLMAIIGIAKPASAEAEEISLSPGSSTYLLGERGESITGDATREFTFSIPKTIDVSISLRVIAGFSVWDDPVGYETGSITLYDSNNEVIDQACTGITNNYGGIEAILPVDTYTLRYTQKADASETRTATIIIDLYDYYGGTDYQAYKPSNRTIDKATEINFDKELVQKFKWGKSETYDNRKYSKNYYKFTIDKPQSVKFRLSVSYSREARISLVDKAGNQLQTVTSPYNAGQDTYDAAIMRTTTLAPGTHYICIENVEKDYQSAYRETYWVRMQAAQDMYRMYNPNTGEHLYTASDSERDSLVSNGWQYEGVMWKAPLKSDTPIYRLYNPNNGDHHYARTLEEYNNLGALGWQQEGIAFYSAKTSSIGIQRLYNPYNPGAGSHNYTTSQDEVNANIAAGWQYEGYGWYGIDWDSDWW